MASIPRLIVCLCMLFGSGMLVIPPVMAQDAEPDPVFSLTVKDEPLIDALGAIAQETGYQFNLTPQWEDHPVSATINALPLEQGLKRLLRSLNHTILWEADKTVVIRVYGKITPGRSGGISFAPPPRPYPEAPSIAPDNEPPEAEAETRPDEGDDQQEAAADPGLDADPAPEDQPDETGRLPADAATRQ